MIRKICKSYVYQIVHLPTLKSYIGSRTAKGCDPSGIGTKYFSSSRDKEFMLEQKEKPENFLYFILKKFDENYKECIEYEIYLHDKYNVGVNKRFYNKSKQTSTGFSTTGTTYICSDKKKRNISIGNKGKKKSESHKKNLSKKSHWKGIHGPMYNKKHTNETIQKMRKPKSEEHRKKISLCQIGRKQTLEQKLKRCNSLKLDKNAKKTTLDIIKKITYNIFVIGKKIPEIEKEFREYGISRGVLYKIKNKISWLEV